MNIHPYLTEQIAATRRSDAEKAAAAHRTARQARVRDDDLESTTGRRRRSATSPFRWLVARAGSVAAGAR